MNEDTESLSDDIVPDVPTHASFHREFAPWHKVRKEYVRREQWNKLIIRYVDRNLSSEIAQHPLSCLVIPGDDLLDIRSLLRDTENHGYPVSYLGFNSRHVESDAVVDGFNDSDFGGGGTNVQGYPFSGSLALGARVALGLRWMSANEIAGPPLKTDTLQVDVSGKF